jgi:hypothetical protein
MPTRIGGVVKPIGARYRPAFAGDLDLQSLTITPPYLGYCPDLNPSLTNLVFFEDCQGIINQDGLLTLESGWERLEDESGVTLPLGGTWNGAVNTAQAPVILDRDVQPVTLLCELSRSDGQDPKRVVFAATSISTVEVAGPPGTARIGFCWYLDPNLDWTNVPWVASYGNPITLGHREHVFDWAPFPIGGTIDVGVNVGAIYFTNFVDQVYRWDPALPGGAGLPGEYLSAFGAFDGDTFHAKSIDLSADRLIMLHTIEGGDLFNKRARWTNVSTTPDLTSAGAGFIDFVEFKGDGLRVLSFQDVTACYFEDGVGFLWRTDNSTNPYNRTYLTKERGLLGTHAVCRITNDLHFGIFEDGWFFLSAGGSWQEAGTLDIGSGRATKWSREFYNLLKVEERDTITVNFDKFTRRIHISFPTTNEDIYDEGVGADVTAYAVWVYDMDTDSVWPDDPYNAVCWGEATAQLAAGMPWADFPGTWANAEGAWGDYSPVFGNRASIHGSESGVIYLHSPLYYTRDEEEPVWSITTHTDIFKDQYSLKTSDRLLLQHGQINPGADATGEFEAYVRTVDGVIEGDTINMKLGGTGRTTTIIHPEVSSYAMGTYMTGIGPIKLYDWQLTMKPSVVPNKEP